MKAVYVARVEDRRVSQGAGAQRPLLRGGAVSSSSLVLGWGRVFECLPTGRMFSLPNLGTGASHPQRTVSTSIHSTSVHSSQTQECSLPRLCERSEKPPSLHHKARLRRSETLRSIFFFFLRKCGCITQLG